MPIAIATRTGYTRILQLRLQTTGALKSRPSPPLKTPETTAAPFKTKLLWEVFPARSKQPARVWNLGLCGSPGGLRFKVAASWDESEQGRKESQTSPKGH